MNQFKRIIKEINNLVDFILLIISIIYLWFWGILLYTEILVYKPYQLAFAITALMIYLTNRFDNLKN